MIAAFSSSVAVRSSLRSVSFSVVICVALASPAPTMTAMSSRRGGGRGVGCTSGGTRGVGGGLEVRQHGGPVIAGRPIIVGEKRPELFVPNVSGTILPSVPTTSAGAISGSDAAARWLPVIAAQLARLTAQEPAAARPQTARGDFARQTALMPGGRL